MRVLGVICNVSSNLTARCKIHVSFTVPVWTLESTTKSGMATTHDTAVTLHSSHCTFNDEPGLSGWCHLGLLSLAREHVRIQQDGGLSGAVALKLSA